MKKFFIKQDVMCGEIYQMIYVRYFWFFEVFYERWNNIESAELRLSELNK